MIVERNSDGTFTAAGNGPIHPIAAEGSTRRDAIRQYSELFVQQRVRVQEECPEAYTHVMDDLQAPSLEGNWEQAWMEDCPQQYARRYAEQEAATALSEMNDLDSLSDSEREELRGDLG